MKLSTREDIEAPISYVFEQVSDFTVYERRALRHGADVSRRDDGPARAGTTWDARFAFRGRDRAVAISLTRLDAPHHMDVLSVSDGLEARTEVELVALSQSRTRVMVAIDVKARTLTARLLLQSLKLAKTKLTKRFKARVLDYAEDIEDRFRRDG